MIVSQNKVSNTYSILAHIFLPFKKANNYLGISYMFVPSGKAVFAKFDRMSFHVVNGME
jgi:hypothetical protein